MARKKKVVEEPVAVEASENVEEQVIEQPIQKEEKIIINTKETCLFQITALTNNVKLYKYPTDKNPQGKLKKGQVYSVTCEINYTPAKMYRLNTGYYIIADQNIRIN